MGAPAADRQRNRALAGRAHPRREVKPRLGAATATPPWLHARGISDLARGVLAGARPVGRPDRGLPPIHRRGGSRVAGLPRRCRHDRCHRDRWPCNSGAAAAGRQRARPPRACGAAPPLRGGHTKHRRPSGRDGLTAFESRILQLLATGMTRNEIAQKLDRSPQTISNALTLAKDKLGARSLTQAAVIVVATYQLAVGKTR